MHTPCLPDLFTPRQRPVAAASLEAFAAIRWTLTEREIAIFRLVHQYCAETGATDVTGGELAAWSGLEKTSIRPRVTGLLDKGWLLKGAIRASRAAREGHCHPVRPALPLSAIERLSSLK